MQRRSSTDADSTIEFAGLTRHNNQEMSNRASKIAGIDTDDAPALSFSSAVRSLESASSSGLAWEVPDPAGSNIDVEAVNDEAPEGVTAFNGPDGGTFVKTDRFQSVVSEDKVRAWVSDSFTYDDGDFADPLFHVPTHNYSIVNPVTAYSPLEEAIRDEDLGDEVFGEIRSYANGGEVHMDVLFDGYSIDYDGDGDHPIVLGIRTGYDFYGDTALYFEGFGQDTRCTNSIRSITEKKVIRHVGEVDLEDEVEEILAEMELMTDRLSELIEMAQEIEVELLDLNFSEAFDHDDDLQAFYELAGFPSYLSREAASHARGRADNQFMPNMTDLWDGATYALTHHYTGGEQTTTAQDYIDTANDFIYNPSLAIGSVQQSLENRLATDSESLGEAEGSAANEAVVEVEDFSESVRELSDEFESRNEELRNTLVAEVQADE